MLELVYEADSKSVAERRVGSSPTESTIYRVGVMVAHQTLTLMDEVRVLNSVPMSE